MLVALLPGPLAPHNYRVGIVTWPTRAAPHNYRAGLEGGYRKRHGEQCSLPQGL